MAYYDALIAAWNSVTQPPAGVIGPGLTPGMPTQQKIDSVNQWKISTPQKCILLATDVYNSMVLAEFQALPPASQTSVENLLSMGTLDASPGTTVRNRFLSFFAAGTQTRTNLANLAAPFDNATRNWCGVNGYPTRNGTSGNLSLSDANNAGLV